MQTEQLHCITINLLIYRAYTAYLLISFNVNKNNVEVNYVYVVPLIMVVYEQRRHLG